MDKDFQSYDVQIRVPTLAGWQAGEGKVCEECVGEALVFGFCCGPPERLRTQGALYADGVGCTLSVGPEGQNGNFGLIVSDDRSAKSDHLDFRVKEGQTVCR